MISGAQSVEGVLIDALGNWAYSCLNPRVQSLNEDNGLKSLPALKEKVWDQ